MSNLIINPYFFAAFGPGERGTEFEAASPTTNSDYLEHSDNTGWADSNKFTASFWVKRTRSGTTERFFDISGTAANANNLRFAMSIGSSDVLAIFGRSSDESNTQVINVTGSTTITDTAWHHVLMSFDLSNAANRHMYIDDAAETLTINTYDTGGTIDFTGTGTYRWALDGTATPLVPFDGALSEAWFDVGTFIDLSVTANRRDFIDAAGDPVDLGSDGSTPTGAAPEIYMSAANGTNTGATASFTKVNSPTSVAGPNP